VQPVQPVADARRDLWQFYATGGFLRRNKVLAQELATLATEGVPLRRVFEFAADGSFMAVRALARPELRSTVVHWVSSDVSANALRHSTWLFRCGGPCLQHPDRPILVPSTWAETRGTYMLHANRTRVDVQPVDVNRLAQSVDVHAFDAFVTISFEHILDDASFLRALPCGAWFVFSVPNFGRPADAAELARSCRAGPYRHECDKHWHTFDNETQIRGYYDGLLRVRRVHAVPHMGNWKKFVVSGQRVCVSHAA
jgi:hypothetical protein